MTEIAMLDRPSTVEGRALFDLNRKAARHWSTIYNMIVDLHGRPVGEVCRLNPSYVAPTHGVHRHNGPRLTEFSAPSPWDNGSWFCRSNGASGPDVISVIEYLGECPRPIAAEWLGRIVDRLVVVEVK